MKEIIGLPNFVVLLLPGGVLAQEQPVKVKGGHELGETAEQFFAEGHEKEVLSARRRDSGTIGRNADIGPLL